MLWIDKVPLSLRLGMGPVFENGSIDWVISNRSNAKKVMSFYAGSVEDSIVGLKRSEQMYDNNYLRVDGVDGDLGSHKRSGLIVAMRSCRNR